jgi:hypothetical protein
MAEAYDSRQVVGMDLRPLAVLSRQPSLANPLLRVVAAHYRDELHLGIASLSVTVAHLGNWRFVSLA